ncbi:MAG: hypothetical protein BWY09_02137 [Candidatus Hydrogenedentes bacterium ADurb.Bin179]|nr:MAG: hypothetical protein BWY09_02137 [Candidatus Hydrogenedentes bacterium ADurb.Bin179]
MRGKHYPESRGVFILNTTNMMRAASSFRGFKRPNSWVQRRRVSVTPMHRMGEWYAVSWPGMRPWCVSMTLIQDT